MARERTGGRVLPAERPLSPFLAGRRRHPLPPRSLRDRRLGHAPLPQAGRDLRVGSALRRRCLRGIRAPGFTLRFLEPLRRLRLSARDRRDRAGRSALPRRLSRSCRARRAAGDGRKSRDLRLDRRHRSRGVLPAETRPGPALARFPEEVPSPDRRRFSARPRSRRVDARSDGGARPPLGSAGTASDGGEGARRHHSSRARRGARAAAHRDADVLASVRLRRPARPGGRRGAVLRAG